MPEQIFNCPVCGGPNQPEAGVSRMARTYCGTNLTIPEHLRTKAIPRAGKIPAQLKPIEVPEIDASEGIRKAQPIAIRAWNLYAYWTWLRLFFPACLTTAIVSIAACLLLGALPVNMKLKTITRFSQTNIPLTASLHLQN